MAEAVLRQHRRRTDRWMPREKRTWTWGWLVTGVKFAAQGVPACLMAFADMLGIPSGLQAAYTAGMAAVGGDIRPAMAGWAASLLMRLISGMGFRWDSLIALLLMTLAPFLLSGRGTAWLMAFVAVTMLPTGLGASLAPTAADMLRGWGAAAIAILSAPVMARALRTLQRGRHFSAMEERVAVGYLAAMCVCGGARMLLLGVNAGMLLCVCAVIPSAMALGAGAGALTGMLGGVVLALQGLPLTIAVALGMGGFLAGVAENLGDRRLTCGAFAMGCILPMLLCGGTGMGCGTAVVVASAVLAMLPRPALERLKGQMRRFLPNDPAPGDAYAAATLSAWEQTIAALARAVPSPREDQEERDGAWWKEHLCQGCPEYDGCGCMGMTLGTQRAEEVWQCRSAPDAVWQGALEHLRGLGCQRLYYLLDSMDALRREDAALQRVARQAQIQRDMLVTHLTAMSGAARRFALLSCGESWWDDMAARRIRCEMAERAIPASLCYVRRAQGHALAAFELQFITGARKQADDMCLLTTAVLGVPMRLSRLDGDRVYLAEQPLLRAEVGAASEAVTCGETCGDTAWFGDLQDGRFLVALSDGMGHGDKAALSSRQTVELLRLCLDAGYSRPQTLAAVNGMLLLGGCGERFATADVLTIDLWQGQASLDKLGAAPSWLYQQGMLTRLTGDALPLGIVEEIDPNANALRLSEGDVLLLLTDGVEDAFATPDALEDAIRDALCLASPEEAAKALLDSAFLADASRRRDDQSAVVVRLTRVQRAQA